MRDFRHRQQYSVPNWIEFLNVDISKTPVVNRSAQLFEDQGKRSVFLEGNGPLFELFVPPDWVFMDDLVQCWSNPRIENFKNSEFETLLLMTKTSNHLLNQPTPLPWSIALLPWEIVNKYTPLSWTLSSSKQRLLALGTCQNEDPKSAVVVGLPHNSLNSLLHWRWLNLWLTVWPEMVFDSHSSPPVVSWVWNMKTSWIQFLQMSWRGRRTFPNMPCVSQLQVSDEVGKTLVDFFSWEFPLRIDSVSWKSLESFIQLVSLCNSCVLAASSKRVSWSSTNFLLVMVSKVLWNLFNSSISLMLFSWASLGSQFYCNNSEWKSCWSRRWSSPAWARWSSSCCDSIVSQFSQILKKTHERKLRLSKHALEFHHQANFPWILAVTPGSQNHHTSFPVLSWFPFYWS